VRLDDPSGPHVIVRFGARGLPTKSNKLRRVPLIPQAVDVMRRWLELLPTYAPDNPLGLAFPTPSGCRRDRGKLYGFHEHLKKAGIRRPVRWHDLRHTCASSLVAGWWGKPWRLEEVRDLLGHSSVEVTERYAHLAGSVLQETANQTRGLAPAQLRSKRDPRGSKSSEPRQKAKSSGAVGQWFESTGAR
jgi:integrase